MSGKQWRHLKPGKKVLLSPKKAKTGKSFARVFNICIIIIHFLYFCSQFFNIENMDKTRAGENVSAQIARMGMVEGLSKGNFALPDGNNFQIKNDGIQPVTLQVRLARMEQGEFIETTFNVGWNPEIVREIKATSLSGINLKWGY